jgi:hypothetical protein
MVNYLEIIMTTKSLSVHEVKDYFLKHDVLNVDTWAFEIPDVKDVVQAKRERFKDGNYSVETLIETITGIITRKFYTSKHVCGLYQVGGFYPREDNRSEWDFYCTGPAFVLVTEKSPHFNNSWEFFQTLKRKCICSCNSSEDHKG